ncbi:MAG: glycolate oxidase subunit GlcF [Pseudomonadota bacterium]
MRTELAAELLATDRGQRAEEILRACVHCGFCNATCPTYQLTGDELDGPRGRIYLIKDMLESEVIDARVQTHLDRCLTCRACETTCPSGVAYGELAEIARDRIEPAARRGTVERLLRWWLLSQLPSRRLFGAWARLGRLFRPLLPQRLGAAIPAPPRALAPSVQLGEQPPPAVFEGQRMLLLGGCVQDAATPATAAAAKRYFERRGASSVELRSEPCCGALPLHLGETDRTTAKLKGWLDWIEPLLPTVDCIVSSASGCGVTLKDYDQLAERHFTAAAGFTSEQQTHYRALAASVTAKLSDPSELITVTTLPRATRSDRRVAWHAPCTLQHGMRLGQQVPALLVAAGYELVPTADNHLCCGSAGTYSVLQPELSAELKSAKLEALQGGRPTVIATANVGCQVHLEGGAEVPVRHWLELVD